MALDRPLQEHIDAVVAELEYFPSMARSRKWLVSATKLNDRTVRSCIEAARADGIFIVTAPCGGYYITDDLDVIERQYRIDRARAISVLRRLKPMRLYLKENGVAL